MFKHIHTFTYLEFDLTLSKIKIENLSWWINSFISGANILKLSGKAAFPCRIIRPNSKICFPLKNPKEFPTGTVTASAAYSSPVWVAPRKTLNLFLAQPCLTSFHYKCSQRWGCHTCQLLGAQPASAHSKLGSGWAFIKAQNRVPSAGWAGLDQEACEQGRSHLRVITQDFREQIAWKWASRLFPAEQTGVTREGTHAWCN